MVKAMKYRADLFAEGVAVMTTYEVTAKRWARGSELHVDGVGVTQCCRLTSAEGMVRDYVILTLDLDDDAQFDVRITPRMDDDIASEVEAAREAVRQAEQAQRDAATRSRKIARRLRDVGLSGAEIAAVLNVSAQRVSQLVNS